METKEDLIVFDRSYRIPRNIIGVLNKLHFNKVIKPLLKPKAKRLPTITKGGTGGLHFYQIYKTYYSYKYRKFFYYLIPTHEGKRKSLTSSYFGNFSPIKY